MEADVDTGTLPISECEDLVRHILFQYRKEICRCRMSDIADMKADVDAHLCPRPGGPAATKQITFQTCWFLLLLLWCCLKTVLEPFSYPARRSLHNRDRWHLHDLHRSGTRHISGHRHRG